MKKVKDLVIGELVKNLISGVFYPFLKKEKCGSGYVIYLDNPTIDGNKFYVDYHDLIAVA